MTLPPAPPASLPEMPEELPRRSRYRRPRRYISWSGLILGLIFGVTGGIFFAWNVSPTEEVETAPWQLRPEELREYVVAVILRWTFDGDLGNAINTLVNLRLGNDDPIQAVADIACELASTGYVDSNSGRYAIRSMIQFYELQGRTGCASILLPNATPQGDITIIPPTSTPTLPPVASKTPTPSEGNRPTPTLPVVTIPTAAPQGDFAVARVETFCDTVFSGIIEIRVRDVEANPLPGMEVRVRWDNGQDSFFTGLKPERGLDYADFQMEAGKGYTVEMPGRSDPTQSLNATSCNTDTGQQAVTSYRVVFTRR